MVGHICTEKSSLGSLVSDIIMLSKCELHKRCGKCRHNDVIERNSKVVLVLCFLSKIASKIWKISTYIYMSSPFLYLLQQMLAFIQFIRTNVFYDKINYKKDKKVKMMVKRFGRRKTEGRKRGQIE